MTIGGNRSVEEAGIYSRWKISRKNAEQNPDIPRSLQLKYKRILEEMDNSRDDAFSKKEIVHRIYLSVNNNRELLPEVLNNAMQISDRN